MVDRATVVEVVEVVVDVDVVDDEVEVDELVVLDAEDVVAASDVVEYFTWSGYEVPELHPGFAAKYGEGHVTGSFFGGEEEALSKLRTGCSAHSTCIQ